MKDITGQRFGRLIALECTQKRRQSNYIWLFICDCGNICEAVSSDVIRGNTKSCGCLHHELISALGKSLTDRNGENNPNYKHGQADSKEYNRLKSHLHRAKGYGDLRSFYTPQEIQDHMNQLGNVCFYCGGNYDEIDHFIPLSRGGSHDLDNLVPACTFCNRSKGSKLYGSEWLPN